MDQDDELIDRALDILMEHFDTAQIFVTRHENGATDSMVAGRGNWYARHSQVDEWMKREDERTRKSARES